MNDNQMIRIFKENILEDFPDAEKYIEKRLRELVAASYGIRRGSHRPREWRDEFYYLALIRQELERMKKTSAASSDEDGMQPMQEVPEELEEAEGVIESEVQAEDYKVYRHNKPKHLVPKSKQASKGMDKST